MKWILICWKTNTQNWGVHSVVKHLPSMPRALELSVQYHIDHIDHIDHTDHTDHTDHMDHIDHVDHIYIYMTVLIF